VVSKVEAQAVGRDQRSRLVHVLAEHAAKGSVKEVGGGVIALGIAPPVARHAGARFSHLHFAGDFSDRGDATVGDAYVACGIDVVFRVNDLDVSKRYVKLHRTDLLGYLIAASHT
jgi:hypothetical protein